MAVRKMKDGRWFCQIENKEVYGGNGRGPSKSGFETKGKAKEWEETTVAAAKERKGMADKAGATMAKLVEAYKVDLDDQVAVKKLKRSTRKLRLLGLRNDIIPRFGAIKCDDFCADMAQAMVRDLERLQGRCGNSMALLHNLISFGLRKRYFIRHPFNGDRVHIPDECRRGDEQIPSPEELIQLKQIVRQPWKPAQDEREWLQDQAFFFLGLHHGLRRGEVCGLRRPEICGAEGADVDLKKGLIRIQFSLNEGVLGEPKSPASKRTLEMTDSMWDLMDRLLYLPCDNRLGLAFSGQNGGDYYVPLYRRWRALMTIAVERQDDGRVLPKFDFHSLRHVLGSVLLEQGNTILFCARVLGHKPETFIKAYAREIAKYEGSTRAALNLAERGLGGERIPLLENARKTQNVDGKVLRIKHGT
jgi:integrase